MSPRHCIVPFYLVLCVLLGGASRAGFLANLVLQLLAIPIIGWALASKQGVQSVPAARLVMLLVSLVAVAMIQLIPLPPGLWTQLPGREQVAAGYEMIGQPLPWLPISLVAEDTLAALLWLLPAIAALLGVVRLGAYGSTALAWFLIGVTSASVLAAAIQVTGGENSPFYFYRVTNIGSGVGFFANSNHQGTLLFCTIPFVAALYADRSRSRSNKDASALAIALGAVALILVVGIAINGSFAGLGLGAATALASLLLLHYRTRRVPGWALPFAGLALLVAVLPVFFGPLSGGHLLQHLETSVTSRQTLIGNTTQIAVGYLPFGSGIATFPAVYRTVENTADITRTWANHAHSDAVEIVLETGVFGLLLLAIFFIWWCRRAYEAWTEDHRPDQFARAAVIASAAVIAHSFVDYPLRTAAISTLFAICLALMAQPRPSVRPRVCSRDGGEEVRHLSA